MARGRSYDWMRLLFTREERRAAKAPPVWDLDPPQREEYRSDLAYYFDLREYARRVMAREVMES